MSQRMEGRKVYHDDDEADECFRKYKKECKDSYRDHSEFLQNETATHFCLIIK